MKFTASYLDDQGHPLAIEASSAELAAWLFVQRQPRSDTSQVTVESHPSVPWRSASTTHYRACDLEGRPSPSDEAEPDLVLRLISGPQPSYVVSGSIDALHLLGRHLLRRLEEFSPGSDPLGLNYVYGTSVIPGSGSRLEHSLCFEVDSDIEQYWARRFGVRGLITEYGSCVAQLLLAAFAGVGVWTVVRWIL